MRIGIIGDSQSEGLAPHLLPLLEARGDQVVDMMLVRGMSVKSLRTDPSRVRRARAVAAQAEALVVILGGNNRLTGDAYRAELEWFLREIAPRAAKVWWVGPAASEDPGWAAVHARTRALQGAFLRAAPRVEWIDAWPMTARGVQFAPDGLHFTRSGYGTWATRLVPKLTMAPAGLLIGAALAGFAVGLFMAINARP